MKAATLENPKGNFAEEPKQNLTPEKGNNSESVSSMIVELLMGKRDTVKLLIEPKKPTYDELLSYAKTTYVWLDYLLKEDLVARVAIRSNEILPGQCRTVLQGLANIGCEVLGTKCPDMVRFI